MPIDPTTKPDERIFEEYTEHMHDVWRDALEEMKLLSSHYGHTSDIWEDFYKRNPTVARNRPNYHSGLEVALVDNAVDSHLAFEPRFIRPPVGNSQESRDKANRVEKGLQSVFQDAFINAPNFSTKENGKQLVLHNYTQLGVMLDHASLVKPEQKRGEDKEDFQLREWEWLSRHNTWNPVRLIVPAPGEVLMSPLEKIPPIAIWCRTMKAYDLEAHSTVKMGQIEQRNKVSKSNRTGYGSQYDTKTRKVDPYEDIEVEEWWSARWHGMKIKHGELLYVEPNTWGIQPFAHCFGGSSITLAGEEFNVAQWIRQGIMYRALPTLTMHNQATVGHHAVLMRSSWARYGYRHDAAEGAEQLTGQILQGEESDWWLERVPQLPGQSFQHKSELERSIERVTYSRMVAGHGVPEVDTATGIIILSENSHRTFKAAISELEHLYSIAASNVLKLVYKMNMEYGENYASIGIGEHTLRTRDMEDTFYVEARFEQIDAVVAQQEAQVAMGELQQGLIDTETYYKVRRYEDPTTLQKGILRDMIMKDPDVVEQMIVNAFKEAGFGELADRRQDELDQRVRQRRMQAQGQEQGMEGQGMEGQGMDMGMEGQPPVEGGMPMGEGGGQPMDVSDMASLMRRRGPIPQPPVPVGPPGLPGG